MIFMVKRGIVKMKDTKYITLWDLLAVPIGILIGLTIAAVICYVKFGVIP